MALFAAERRGRRRTPAAWQPGEDGKEMDGAEAVVVEGDERQASSSSTASLTLVVLLLLGDRIRVAINHSTVRFQLLLLVVSA